MKHVVTEYYQGLISFKEKNKGLFELTGAQLYSETELRDLQAVVGEILADIDAGKQQQVDLVHKARMDARFNPMPSGTEVDI